MVMNNNEIKRLTKQCSCQNLDETSLNLDHIGSQQHLPLDFHNFESWRLVSYTNNIATNNNGLSPEFHQLKIKNYN